MTPSESSGAISGRLGVRRGGGLLDRPAADTTRSASVFRIPLHARDGSVRAFALVDEEDFERFGGMRWSWTPGGYVARQVGGRSVALHREIMGLARGDGLEVDHRDRNPLNCRRANLRVTTRAGNAQNVPAKPGARSRYRGVSFFPQRGLWRARVGAVTVGYRHTEFEAALLAESRRREVFPLAEPDPELVRALAARRAAAA